MLKKKVFLAILSALLCCPLNVGIFRSWVSPQSAWAGDTSDIFLRQENAVNTQDELFSSTIAERLYEVAYMPAYSDSITESQAEQAIILLTAAKQLNNDPSRRGNLIDSETNRPTSERILFLLLKLACENAKQDYSQQVYHWLVEYIDGLIDLDVVKKAITYLLDHCDTREQRERILGQMLNEFGAKNPVIESELATLLGLLMVEKADFDAAQSLFVRAYLKDRYNNLAFDKLVELAPDKINPAIYFEHLRLILRKNPMDIEAALAFAQYAESAHSGHLYEIAAAAYQYCVDLFSYLYPNTPLPPDIYLPWIISSYNTRQNQSKCLQIAELVRRSGRFDIFVEAIAGRAAAKIGDAEGANRIFQAAELRAQELLKQGPLTGQSPPDISASQLAWFYCFSKQDALRALDWANKAYSADSASPVAASLLAYALAMNQQLNWARPLIENYEHNQIADLVQAQIQLADGQKETAIETLKTAILRDPGSLVAERAKELLDQQGQPYRPPVDPDYIMTALRNSFGQTLIPEFMSPDKIISIQLSSSTNEFSFGSESSLLGQIAIINNFSEPLVIRDDSLFSGSLRIDVDVSGDLNRKILKLISFNIGSVLSIEPGKRIVVPVRLIRGELKQLLRSFPQASLNMKFQLYLEPMRSSPTERSGMAEKLMGVMPAAIEVKRPAVELSSSYLRNRYNSISTARTSQKISIAELFVGLLKEQQSMAEQAALYRYKYADWMPGLLKSALSQKSGLLIDTADDEWEVKVYTMAEMLSLPLDSELINAVAKNLNHPKWPVRMMALYLLAKSADSEFGRVLSWAAENDSSRFVRDMAVALNAERTQGKILR